MITKNFYMKDQIIQCEYDNLRITRDSGDKESTVEIRSKNLESLDILFQKIKVSTNFKIEISDTLYFLVTKISGIAYDIEESSDGFFIMDLKIKCDVNLEKV